MWKIVGELLGLVRESGVNSVRNTWWVYIVCVLLRGKGRGWIFASNDGKAVHYCKHHATACITLNDILAALWQSGTVTKDIVAQIINRLEAGGRRIKAKVEILSD